MIHEGNPEADNRRAECVRIGRIELGPGDHVRLRPSGQSDIFDLVLEGLTATIESIERDFEDQLYLAVVLDDDAGRELNMLQKPGHPFYFHLDEVEPVNPNINTE